ncbi:hypothetical protein ABW19_dt0204408 [Dactylella cylindrospora]|nr:hypothetical protein ABW19_dt0204408 [Dactylella cylindrospora]
MDILSAPLENPVKSVFTLYAVRTLVILSLALGSTYLFPEFSPLGYDTSSTHVTEYGSSVFVSQSESSPPTLSDHVTELSERLVTALTRWDAIYFAGIASRGHIWEQEWAFGIGQSYILQALQWVLKTIADVELNPSAQILALTILSCLSHLLSAILLYHLTLALFGTIQPKEAPSSTREVGNNVAFLAAALHILSPAGVFLTAPYNESVFSALSFLGYLLYTYAIKNTAEDGRHGVLNDILFLLSGALFGVSCLFRANGIMNGVLFLFELSQSIWRLSSGKNPLANIRSLVASGFAGVLVGAPSIWRQYQGWIEFCGLEASREWCSDRLPSIYSFVQKQYWGVGFMRYWTPGNIPLFLLAAPMLFVLLKTSFDVVAILTPTVSRLYSLDLKQSNRDLLFRLTVPQLLLATLAITNYHVQIITRLSSGLPMWYIVMGAALVEAASAVNPKSSSEEAKSQPQSLGSAFWSIPALRFFLGYQVTQAVLYGGFLPPA